MLLDQAISGDRHYGPALAWAAVCHMTFVRDGWAETPETNRCKGIDFARQALGGATVISLRRDCSGLRSWAQRFR